MTYGGTAGPGLCRRADGRIAIYGIWLVARGQSRPDVQAWLGQLFPATAGRTSSFSQIDRMLRSQDTYLYVRDARVLGFETLNLRAGEIDAVVVEWDDAGTGQNIFRARNRRWLDTATGALVKSERRILGGSGEEHAWEAVSITQRTGVVAPTSTSSSR